MWWLGQLPEGTKMTTVIKEIEGKQIWFKEADIPNYRLGYLFLTIGTILALAGIALVTASHAIILQGNDGTSIQLLGVLTLVFGLLAMVHGAFGTNLGLYHSRPGYRVGSSLEYKEIIKTTPEADQIAICKAAKELESKVLEHIAHEKQLKQIAERCK